MFGASGPTGRQVVAQALASGHTVVAVTRRPDVFPIRAPGLTIMGADVEDAPAVARAVAGTEAVISTFGVPLGRRPISVYSNGICNLLAAMDEHGVRRLVCVSSTTLAGASPDESLLGRWVFLPLLRHVLGRTLYDDVARMEAIVPASAADWTIVRPGGLFDTEAPTSTVTVPTHHLAGR